MSKQPDAKPNSKAKTKPSKQAELSTEQLDQVSGGVSDIAITKVVDKPSPIFH